MVSTVKIDIEAGGISNEWERLRFIVRACIITKLCWWDNAVMSRIPDDQIGSILMMHFNSSTLWIVANFRKFGCVLGSLASSSVIIAALSSHLEI